MGFWPFEAKVRRPHHPIGKRSPRTAGIGASTCVTRGRQLCSGNGAAVQGASELYSGRARAQRKDNQLDNQTALRMIGFLVAREHSKEWPGESPPERFPLRHLKTFHAYDYPTVTELATIEAGFAEYFARGGKLSRAERAQMRQLEREPHRRTGEADGPPAFTDGLTGLLEL